MSKTIIEQTREMYEEQWKPAWSTDPLVSALPTVCRATMHAVEKVLSHGGELRTSGKFTTEGFIGEIQLFAKTNAVPTIRDAVSKIRAAEQAVISQRSKLAVPSSDLSDARQGEERSWIRSMGAGPAMAHLLGNDADEATVVAVLQGPPGLSGLTFHQREEVKDSLMRKRYGKDLDFLEDLEEAVTLSKAMLSVSTMQLRRGIGFGDNDDAQFDGFLGSN